MKRVFVATEDFITKSDMLAIAAREGTVYALDRLSFSDEAVATITQMTDFAVHDGYICTVADVYGNGYAIEPKYLFVLAVEDMWYFKNFN